MTGKKECGVFEANNFQEVSRPIFGCFRIQKRLKNALNSFKFDPEFQSEFTIMQKTNLQTAPKLKAFAVALFAIEAVIIVLFGIFVRVTYDSESDFNLKYYPMYQDVNVMMLVGFGFLMAYIRGYDWSALSYTFFINAVAVQLYILLSAFWSRVFHGGWNQSTIFLSEPSFILASYSVASILIAFGAPLGKCGPLELLILAILGVVGYSLNEGIIYQVLEVIDVGGSTGIHTYGAFLGMAFTIMLGRKIYPQFPFTEKRQNSTFAMIGTLFLWMFWPSFNAASFPQTDFQKTFVVTNTIVSLTGSCLSAFATSIFKRGKFNINDILNGTLAGGVAIGASASVVANTGIALLIGVLAGILATLSEILLTERLRNIKIHDTIGILYLHGFPGLMGGCVSAMVIASYQTYPGLDEHYKDLIVVTMKERTFSQQAGIQVACTFISAAVGILFGLLSGLLASLCYNLESPQHYSDGEYFELHPDEIPEFESKRKRKSSISTAAGNYVSGQNLVHVDPNPEL